MIFVDTNFFLRFLLEDIEEQHQEAKQLFQQAAQGRISLITSTIVIFEIYWVLSSFYKRQKSQLTNLLTKILAMTFIALQDRAILTESLKLFKKTNLNLEDCYNLSFAKSQKVESFKTFDAKLVKIFSSTANSE